MELAYSQDAPLQFFEAATRQTLCDLRSSNSAFKAPRVETDWLLNHTTTPHRTCGKKRFCVQANKYNIDS